MSGKSSRTKGFGYEREVVNQIKQAGLDARRMFGSDGRSSGLSADTDIYVDGRYSFQLERTKTIRAKYRPTDGTVGSIFREDKGESFALIRLDFLIELLKSNREVENG